MIKLTNSDLLKHLEEKQLKPQMQNETGQIVMAFRLNNKDFPIFLRIAEDEDFLQVLSFLPTKIKEGQHSAIARFLHHVNNQVNLPGFSMDDQQDLVFYRIILPCPGRELSEQMLEKFLGAIFNVSNTFYPIVSQLSEATISYKDAMKKLRELRPETSVQTKGK
jgi:hypothetical protein